MKQPVFSSQIKRSLLITTGILSLGLGILGVILPGLPTTPFILLSATCFANASPRLHAWLLNHRYLGPVVRDWEKHHSLPKRIKWLASIMMLMMVSLSVWQFRERPVLQGIILLLGLLGAWVVWRIPTRPASPHPDARDHP